MRTCVNITEILCQTNWGNGELGMTGNTVHKYAIPKDRFSEFCIFVVCVKICCSSVEANYATFNDIMKQYIDTIPFDMQLEFLWFL